MVTATVALKVVQYINLAFMIGMTTFPGPMLDAYQIDFTCPAKPPRGSPPCDATKNTAFVYFVFCIFGIQLGTFSTIVGGMARPVVSKKAQSVTCLIAGLAIAFLTVSDLSYTMAEGWPSTTPKDGIYANAVLFSVVCGLLFLGWKDSGSVVPSMGKMIPSGRFGLPILLGCLNLLFFGVPLVLFREAFAEQYGAGKPIAGQTADAKFFIYVMMGNTGKMMIWNVILSFAICSADNGDAKDDTMYRLLRGVPHLSMFFLGSFAKDGIVQLLAGWPDPMRVVTFVQCFGVTFYQINAWASAEYTLKKAK